MLSYHIIRCGIYLENSRKAFSSPGPIPRKYLGHMYRYPGVIIFAVVVGLAAVGLTMLALVEVVVALVVVGIDLEGVVGVTVVSIEVAVVLAVGDTEEGREGETPPLVPVETSLEIPAETEGVT